MAKKNQVNTYLESVLEDIIYQGIDAFWLSQVDVVKCGGKDLFSFQSEAVQNAVKALYEFFMGYIGNASNGKEWLYGKCKGKGMNEHICDIDSHKEADKFSRFVSCGYPTVSSISTGSQIIESVNFFNRVCFWMATASGKTVILVKMIEILDKLMSAGLIPKRDILVLFPNEKIMSQFDFEVTEYNSFVNSHSVPIHVFSLKDDYENNKYSPSLFKEIPVYTYRSDLFSEKDSKKRVSLDTYDNNGEWYVFVDEAHKGNRDDSLRQEVVTLMTRNGFLFNFSATFTDELDFATTCKNYNLERFIKDGYGKNVYLSDSTFDFKSKKDLLVSDKQLQVLKSLITLTWVKKEKQKTSLYHHPLMVTFVNSVAKDQSDIDLFFEELAKIAACQVDMATFDKAKEELLDEFTKKPQYQFGKEGFDIKTYRKTLSSVKLQDVLKQCFNASKPGSIEILEGEKGCEFALKVQTSEEPFALFRIGDAERYVSSKLKRNYIIIKNPTQRFFFNELNSTKGECFNILIGSRMFYEGWDSNRPNVINYINIGTEAESKKLILQSLGRGVRIEPGKPGTARNEVRKRLPVTDSDKNSLLETLFVFATNKEALKAVMETMEAQKSKKNMVEYHLKKTTTTTSFDSLLIPTYKNNPQSQFVQFKIAQASFDLLKQYVDLLDDSVLCLRYGATSSTILKLRNEISKPLASNKDDFFFKANNWNYKNDVDGLLKLVLSQFNVNEKQVDKIKSLTGEIIHFDHIQIDDNQWANSEISQFVNFINSAINSTTSLTDLAKQLLGGAITEKDFLSAQSKVSPSTTIKDLDLHKLLNHYYVPLILSKNAVKLDYIKHIIDEKSEVDFINNLINFNTNHGEYQYDWMFSKIDQTIDDKAIAMPYFNQKLNCYSKFFPDFIFWQKKDAEYIITFIDPKGTAYTDYEDKVDAFERMFVDSTGKPKVFQYNNYEITFQLKLVCDPSKIKKGSKYSKYWLANNDFSWLK